jgi:hypothetical protein
MPGLIIVMGFGLLFVSGSASGQLTQMWDLITNQASAVTTDEKTFALTLGEILFIIILATLASTSPEFGTFGVVILAALWVLWMVKNPTALQNLTGTLSGNVKG